MCDFAADAEAAASLMVGRTLSVERVRQLNAKDYLDKVQQTCFVGGLCVGVKPVKTVGPASTIAGIIGENLKRLQDKMAKNPLSSK